MIFKYNYILFDYSPSYKYNCDSFVNQNRYSRKKMKNKLTDNLLQYQYIENNMSIINYLMGNNTIIPEFFMKYIYLFVIRKLFDFVTVNFMDFSIFNQTPMFRRFTLIKLALTIIPYIFICQDITFFSVYFSKYIIFNLIYDTIKK